MSPTRSATRDFFDLLGEVRQERGLSYAQLASRTGIDRATLQRWFTRRLTLPSWDEIRPLVHALDPGRESEWLQRWRQATHDEAQPAREPAPVPAPRRPRRTLLALVAVAVLLAAGVLAYRVIPRGGTAAGRAPEVFSSPAPPTTGDTAWSGDRAAHAQFVSWEKGFLLYDDRTDSRSAVLFLSSGGMRIGPVYNSTGRTGRVRKGRPVPPQPVEIDTLDPSRPLDFRVCAGERGKPLPLDTCGPWTRVPSA